MTNEVRNLEFISLKDFLMLPFINPYSECIVHDFDTDRALIGETKIKDLIAAINAGNYKELEEDYYVSDLMPRVSWDKDKIYYGRYSIHLRRF